MGQGYRQTVTESKLSRLAFKNVLEEGEAFLDERKSTMVSTLDRNITELNDTLLSILAEMHSGSYVKEVAPTQDTNLAVTLMRMINSMIDVWQPTEDSSELPKEWTPERVMEVSEYLFLLSIVWSVGGPLASQEHREKFDAMIHSVCPKTGQAAPSRTPN